MTDMEHRVCIATEHTALRLRPATFKQRLRCRVSKALIIITAHQLSKRLDCLSCVRARQFCNLLFIAWATSRIAKEALWVLAVGEAKFCHFNYYPTLSTRCNFCTEYLHS